MQETLQTFAMVKFIHSHPVWYMYLCVCVCVCVCARACVRACVHAAEAVLNLYSSLNLQLV